MVGRIQHSQESRVQRLNRPKPTKTLADDVAVTKSAIDSLNSEVVLVGQCELDLNNLDLALILTRQRLSELDGLRQGIVWMTRGKDKMVS